MSYGEDETGRLSNEEVAELELDLQNQGIPTNEDGDVDQEELNSASSLMDGDPTTTSADTATLNAETPDVNVTDVDTDNNGTITPEEMGNTTVEKQQKIFQDLLKNRKRYPKLGEEAITLDHETEDPLPAEYKPSLNFDIPKDDTNEQIFHDDNGQASPYMEDVVNNQGMLNLMTQTPTAEGASPFLGIEDKEGGEINLPKMDMKLGGGKVSGFGHKSYTPFDTFQEGKAPMEWDDVKKTLQSFGGGSSNGIAGVGTLDGISEDNFNPEVENPSYSTGQEIELPGTDSASSSTGPTTKLFHDIMSGNFKGATDSKFDIPHTPNAVGGKKTSTLAKMSKNKKAEKGESPKMAPMKLKNAVTQGKENIYERIIDKVDKNFMSWPLAPDGESHIKEKGTIAVYAKKDWVSVKYGSYRKTLLDTFAQEHPQFLPQILEVVNS